MRLRSSGGRIGGSPSRITIDLRGTTDYPAADASRLAGEAKRSGAPVVISMHTPEFEFQKNIANVPRALHDAARSGRR